MADVDRGVASALGYAVSLGVMVLLVTGLITAVGGFAADERARTIRSEAEVVGQRIATELQTADRLARESDGGTVRVNADVPATLAGKSYTVRIVANSSRSVVVLRTEDPEVSVVTPFRNVTRVETTAVTGGPLVISYDGSVVEVRADE